MEVCALFFVVLYIFADVNQGVEREQKFIALILKIHCENKILSTTLPPWCKLTYSHSKKLTFNSLPVDIFHCKKIKTRFTAHIFKLINDKLFIFIYLLKGQNEITAIKITMQLCHAAPKAYIYFKYKFVMILFNSSSIS